MMTRQRNDFRFFIVASLASGFVGCASIKKSFVGSGPVRLEQSGEALVPASASERLSELHLPVPKGSEISVEPRAPDESASAVRIKLADDSSVKISTRENFATGARSFAPPPPPSPLELAKGSGVKVFYFLAAFLALAAIGLAYVGHGKAAMFAGLGAVGIPAAIEFFSSGVALAIGTGAVCVAGALFAAWHLMRKKL